MSEYESYLLIDSGLKTAQSLGFKVTYSATGWLLYHEKAKLQIHGNTAEELHHYLNGVRDGVTKDAKMFF